MKIKSLNFNIVTTGILIIFLVAIAIITIVYGHKIDKRLNRMDKDIRKRPVIEYHYYEDTHRKVGQ